MKLRDDLKSKLTTRNLAIAGIFLIAAGNSFTLVAWNIKFHELLANIGATILFVGVLQWLFDEDSRQQLISRIITDLTAHLDRRDTFGRLGATECTLDSKSIVSETWAEELIAARNLAIGIHYSDGLVIRFETIIRARIAQNKVTQILHSNPNGIARSYLENYLSKQIDLQLKVDRLQNLIQSRFNQSTRIKLIQHERVLRYSFVYSDSYLWIIFLTNSETYQPTIPAIRFSSGSPLYNFFERDILGLGTSS